MRRYRSMWILMAGIATLSTGCQIGSESGGGDVLIQQGAESDIQIEAEGDKTDIQEVGSEQSSIEKVTEMENEQSAIEKVTEMENEQNATEKMTEMENERMEISVQECKIMNGENEIYGKLYMPVEDGAYPAIILSHGYNGCNQDFQTECRYYAEHGYVAYAYDFCGGSTRSKSSGKSTDMTISSEKSDLLAVFDSIKNMECVDKENVVLFGGSQGGLVTTLAAEERKDEVKAVALYFPALCVADDWRKKYPNLDSVPESFDFWGLTLGKGFVEDIHDLDIFDSIGGYKGDVLILHGDKDPIVPFSYSERAVQQYENASLIKMEGEGHGFTPTGGEIAMEKVLNFLNEHCK